MIRMLSEASHLGAAQLFATRGVRRNKAQKYDQRSTAGVSSTPSRQEPVVHMGRRTWDNSLLAKCEA
eukprot:4277826-Amphidinium_carterae.1